ncbi:hypothetical protein NLI96_g10880 [Meripilus lineatus]|uniref:DNA 3'-5' helicase n=1 Tax=Meripilus lineatus TaxID=2056292 RepID=A0AAD5YDT5_9APHY|nr:hypothetical protein NLI96_g10880 [Physisporinus lineatus]
MEIPTLSDIRKKTIEKLGRRPCLWQLKIAQAILKREKDVVCIAGTGSGKTLTFWMPLLFRDGIQIVITPLNILGAQNVEELKSRGIPAISISAETATLQNLKDVESGKYRVVVINPEKALGSKSVFERIWRNPAFTSKIISVVWDEAHCITSWGSFREEYAEAGRLRDMLPRSIPYLVPSATLPEATCEEVMRILGMRKQDTSFIKRSNDRPNVYLTVRKIEHSLTSFKDLDFLIPKGWKPSDPLPKFLVFFDDIKESIAAVKALRARLPKRYRRKIVWFNSNNTPKFREKVLEDFKGKGLYYGLCCTDSFGLGIDLADIEIIVQWRATCDLNALWQRFGRAARAFGSHGLAIFLVESKHFDETKRRASENAKAAENRALQKEREKQTAKRKSKAADKGPNKRARTEAPLPIPSTSAQSSVAPNSSRGLAASRSLTRFEELRVAFRQGASKRAREARVSARKAETRSEDVDPSMDAFINAGDQSRGIMCYRAPIMAFYENDLLESDHMQCVPTGDGCMRCAVSKPISCCSLCHPYPPQFEPYNVPPPPVIRLPRMSTVPTADKYKPSTLDLDFRRVLNSWRRQKIEDRWGPSFLKNMGPGFVLGDDTLARIADCARVGKITNLETLERETRWCHARRYGPEILRLISENYPTLPDATPPLPLQPQSPTSANIPSTSTSATAQTSASNSGETRAKAPRTCGACGMTGHISMFFL